MRVGLIVLLAGALGAGAFLWREPIARGIATGATTVWDAWAEWSSSLRARAAEVPPPTPVTTLPAPEPRASWSVLMTVGSTAAEAGFVLAVQHPSEDPELVMIPQTLLVQVPGFGEFSMAEALEFGGPRLAVLALSNEMGIRIDDLVPIPSGGLGEVASGMVVDVPVELFVEGADGSRRLIAEGTQRLSMDLVELLLVTQGAGNQFEWLVRQEAVWLGLLEAMAQDGEVASRLTASAGDPDGTAALLEAIAAVPVIGAPPVDRVALGASRDGLVLATDRIGAYLDDRLAHLVLGEGRRPRVEILNGNGLAGSSTTVAEILVGDGFYVFRSGNADRFDYEASLVIAQGEDAAPAARAAAALLGISDVQLESRAPSGVVDVSIIVGTDLASREG